MIKRSILIISLLFFMIGTGTASAQHEDKGPKVGSTAPVFKLKTLDGKGEFDLETFNGKKPLILFFGSYT